MAIPPQLMVMALTWPSFSVVSKTASLTFFMISPACSITSIERFIPISFTRVFAIDYTEEDAEAANALRPPYATGNPLQGAYAMSDSWHYAISDPKPRLTCPANQDPRSKA